jgi:hypothetical protein
MLKISPIRAYSEPGRIIMQSIQDDNYEALETAVEKISIFLNLLALQKRLNCDELWILERVVKVLALVHPDDGVPELRSAAHAGG